MKVQLSKRLPTVLLLTILLFFSPSALADTHPNRVALAISGGASMGAYEAGMIWGLVKILRQAEITASWSVGGEPRPIEIASIAGTSAGGINSLLAALAWSVKPEKEGGFANRIDDNIFRDVWLTPDVNRLLPPDADSPQYLPDDALLSRKDLVAAARELREKWRRPGTFPPGTRLPLGFTVTRVRPEAMIVSGIAVKNQRFHIPFELRARKDGSANFGFDPNDYPVLIEPSMILMPWSRDDAPFSISDQQIEDTLLATSAFPLGFGRRRIQYCRKMDFPTDSGPGTSEATETAEDIDSELVCPDGYELAEAEFADGGLFDNIPIGMARILAESGKQHLDHPLPIEYLYLDPERIRYELPVMEDLPACMGKNPPEACRTLTFDLASETEILGDAIGTARKYELYRELTSEIWRLNLSGLCRKFADALDAKEPGSQCPAVLPYFNGRMDCSDRLRSAGRLLEIAHSYRIVPIKTPFSTQALMQTQTARSCEPISDPTGQDVTSECDIDVAQLRKQIAEALTGLTKKVDPKNTQLKKDIRQSALSIDSDRQIHVSSRGGPITGTLMGAFGAFLDYKFREFDYYVGIYDAVVLFANARCQRSHSAREQQGQFAACHDRLSKELYDGIGVADSPKSRYTFALMAKREFGANQRLRFAYDPMPPIDRDVRIIFDGLNKIALNPGNESDASKGMLATEREFFGHLQTEGFEPTPAQEDRGSLLTRIAEAPAGGHKSLLENIMADPEYWSHELVGRTTNRLVYLEKQADAVYRAREPDPEKQEKANTELMGAASLVLRTATYKYAAFDFSPSTAPRDWFWRNIIPYEATFDLVDGDLLIFWQPTWHFKPVNLGIRAGLGFVGGAINQKEVEKRKNFGTIGLDFTRLTNSRIFSGWGITPALYHQWSEPSVGEQTTLGGDLHANLFYNRMRISLGARDVIDNADGTLFLTLGITDLPGIIYWLSR